MIWIKPGQVLRPGLGLWPEISCFPGLGLSQDCRTKIVLSINLNNSKYHSAHFHNSYSQYATMLILQQLIYYIVFKQYGMSATWLSTVLNIPIAVVVYQ